MAVNTLRPVNAIVLDVAERPGIIDEYDSIPLDHEPPSAARIDDRADVDVVEVAALNVLAVYEELVGDRLAVRVAVADRDHHALAFQRDGKGRRPRRRARFKVLVELAQHEEIG